MRTSTPTLLSLYEWAHFMGINPWDLAQVGEGFPGIDGRACEHVWFQNSWQTGEYLSREEIGVAIAEAEEMLAQQLGYWPAPKYIEETVESPSSFWRQSYMSGYNSRGQKSTYNANWKYIIGGGSLARTLIDASVNLTYSDVDNDGIDDTFTLSFPTTVTNPDEIGIYPVDAERLGEDIDETWRIRPVKVTISGGTATVIGPRSLMVLPVMTSGFDVASLDVTVDANFLTEVAVYRVYLSTTATDVDPQQGYALWEAWPEECCEEPCVQSTKALYINERMSQMGQISVAFADTECPSWRAPDRIRIKYLSGIPLVNGRVDRQYGDVIAKLATALLPSGACGCARADKILDWWRGLPSSEDGATNRRLVTFEEIYAPFGERRGAIWAWKRVKTLKELGFGVIG